MTAPARLRNIKNSHILAHQEYITRIQSVYNHV